MPLLAIRLVVGTTAMRIVLSAGQQAVCRSSGFLPLPVRSTQSPRAHCAPWKAAAVKWQPQHPVPAAQRAAGMATAAAAASGAAAGAAFPR